VFGPSVEAIAYANPAPVVSLVGLGVMAPLASQSYLLHPSVHEELRSSVHLLLYLHPFSPFDTTTLCVPWSVEALKVARICQVADFHGRELLRTNRLIKSATYSCRNVAGVLSSGLAAIWLAYT
jgi:hypothetical protein